MHEHLSPIVIRRPLPSVISACHSCSDRTDGFRERKERIASHAAFAADSVVV